MKFKNNKNMDMVNGPLLRNVILFSLPLMASNLLQIAFNAADTIVVGKFAGQISLAAVGGTGPIVNLLVNLFNGLSVGANIVIARMIGKGDDKGVENAVHTSYFIALAGGILLTILGILFSPMFLTWIGTPENTIQQAELYIRLYFCGSIPLLVYNFGAAIMRSKGDTARPTVYLTISGILNVVLNLFFVIVLNMNVAGVALATVLSETVSAVLVTKALIQEHDNTRLIPKRIRPQKELFQMIMKIGMPAGLQGMMWSISNIAVQASLNTFGSLAVAGNSAAANIECFVYIGIGALSQACITFTSQCAGAGKKERVRKVMWLIVLLTTIVSLPACTLLLYFGRTFLGFYTNDLNVIEMGMIRMKYVAFPLWLNGVLDIPASSMRGMGYSTTPTIVMLIGIVGVRLAYIATVWQAVRTLDVLYLCFPISWIIAGIVFFVLWHIIYKRYISE